MKDKETASEVRGDEVLESEPRIYEVGFHIIPLVTEEGIPAEVDAVRNVIESAGGTVFAEEWPKRMTLAYPMRTVIHREHHTFTDASFGWVKFEGGAAAAVALKDALTANPNILRFLITKTIRDTSPRRRFVTPTASHAEGIPAAESLLSKEQMDAEIEKLVVE